MFCAFAGLSAIFAPAVDIILRYGHGPEAVDAWFRDMTIPRLLFWQSTMLFGILLLMAGAGGAPGGLAP